MQRFNPLAEELTEVKYDSSEPGLESKKIAPDNVRDDVLKVYNFLFEAITKVEAIQSQYTSKPSIALKKSLFNLRREIEKSLHTTHLALRLTTHVDTISD